MTGRGGLDSRPPESIVLDTDGVLLDSAVVHAAAWKIAFDACLDRLAPDIRAFVDLLRTKGVTAFADAGPALMALRTAGVPCAAVSASRHARTLIRAAGLAGLLTVIVDGEDAAGLGLAGKPDPALFLRAAALLGSRAQESAVAEDALAGVEAARRGGFGLVVGVDRTPLRSTTALLREQGADLVVPDLAALVRSVWGERG
ncbi:HAD family hydrolase [Streptomyces flavochromogenes]|uniref:HAD family hydrolase n=1 Tax=Streptomyces flavochromogenes TaxID=68199 RepID=A0ABW6Y3R3_9ACTN